MMVTRNPLIPLLLAGAILAGIAGHGSQARADQCRSFDEAKGYLTAASVEFANVPAWIKESASGMLITFAIAAGAAQIYNAQRNNDLPAACKAVLDANATVSGIIQSDPKLTALLNR
jgi:hypothetical protein